MKKDKKNFKRLMIFTIAVAMYLVVLPPMSAECPTEIVSYWKLDDGSGSTATDSFNENDGTIYGATWTSGKVGNALSFDGIDDYVNIPDEDSLSFGDGISSDHPFSISAWVYMDTSIIKQRFVSKADNFNPADGEYLLTTDGYGRFSFFLCDKSLGFYPFIGRRWSELPSIDQWYYVVGTYDGSGSSNGIKLYVDGVQVDDTDDSRPYEEMENTNKPLYLGKYGSNYLDGMLDEVAIWNKELTADEISALYCLGTNGIGYTDDFEYTGNLILPQSTDPVILEATLTDSSGNGVEGCDVTFYLNDESVGSAMSNADGVASLDYGSLEVGVYNVYASVCCFETDHVYLAIYDPNAGFVTGGGWINSPAGAYGEDETLEGKANFGFVSKYKKGQQLPTGNTEFKFEIANLDFHSTNYEWLVIANAKAMYKGTGTINDEGEYKFMISAIDGQINGAGSVDKFRIKIWEEDENGDEVVIYDNQIDDDENEDPSTEISGGQIKIHSK